MEAVGRYQAEHGVDYPCGKPDDVHRVFDPEDYQKPVRVLGESDYLGGEVQLSSKACPSYYGRLGTLLSHEEQKKGRCGCPEGQCWYDAQLARRGRVQRALTPEAWNALIAGTAVEPDYHIKGGVPVPMTPEDVEKRLKACDDALELLIGKPKKKPRSLE
jgi:hypothetical protein